MIDLPTNTDALNHVYWLGGASGAGKSTIARRIAEAHEMILYSTDEVMEDHAQRCNPEECPGLEAFKRMTMDQRWVDRSPQLMLDSFHWYNGEAFDLIVEDLCAFPRDKRVIVEGFRLLPHLVTPLLTAPRQALWLIPTAQFRLTAFASRGTLWDIPNKTSQPKIALRNLLERDRMFAERLEQEVSRQGLTTILVNGGRSEDQLLNAVEAHFRF